MRGISLLFKNPYFYAYLAVYAICFVLLVVVGGYGAAEAVLVFVLFGLAFPSISYWLSSSATPLGDIKASLRGELPVLTILIAIITIYLSVGPEKINAIVNITHSSPKLFAIMTLVQKLTIFVFIPILLLHRRFGFTLKDFGIGRSFHSWFAKKHIRILIGLSLLLIVFQFYVGQAAAPVRQGTLSAWQLGAGIPLTYLWLILEVGLVEEFFFRAVLQSRITAYLKSDIGGVVISALFFGLAHAPGLILRGGGANSPVGPHPSTLFAICFSVVVLSAAGLFLSIVWARTRNLLLVVMIHAATDLLPGLSTFVKTWGIR